MGFLKFFLLCLCFLEGKGGREEEGDTYTCLLPNSVGTGKPWEPSVLDISTTYLTYTDPSLCIGRNNLELWFFLPMYRFIPLQFTLPRWTFSSPYSHCTYSPWTDFPTTLVYSQDSYTLQFLNLVGDLLTAQNYWFIGSITMNLPVMLLPHTDRTVLLPRTGRKGHDSGHPACLASAYLPACRYGHTFFPCSLPHLIDLATRDPTTVHYVCPFAPVFLITADYRHSPRLHSGPHYCPMPFYRVLSGCRL